MNKGLNIGNKTTIRSFTDLNAWIEGHKLVLMIYNLTKLFPKEEMFGLISQMRRCAVSITSNIAEGFSRQSYKKKVQFYSVAQQTVIVHKIINGLIKSSKSHDS